MDHVGIEGTGAESNAPAGSDLTRRWLAGWLAIGIDPRIATGVTTPNSSTCCTAACTAT